MNSRPLVSTFLLALLCASIATPQTPVPIIDVSKLGPQIGDRVPDFNLRDQNGNLRNLASIAGPQGTMLVFVRSADWCPYCKTQLVELQSQFMKVKERGLGLAAISYDSPEIMAAFSKQHGIAYPLLSDAGSATIKKYGLLNPLPEQAFGPNRDDPTLKAEIAKYVGGAGARQEMIGMALPGTLILDRNERVTARYFEDFYVERNTISSLLVKLGGAGASVEGTKTSTNHLDVTSYVSDAVVAPGNHFSVVLDVTPHPRVHVYAPGAEANGYRVIALKLDPNPQIRTLAAQYAKPETYYFKPLQEHVPVFQKAFRLSQELVLDGSAASQQALRGKDEITITGTLQYQACDEKTCFTPVSLPLTWKVKLRDLIRERPVVAPSPQPGAPKP